MEDKPIQPVRIGLVAQLSLPATPLPQKLKEIVSVVGVQLFLRVHETEGIQCGSCIYAVFKDWHIRLQVGTSLLQE